MIDSWQALALYVVVAFSLQEYQIRWLDGVPN